MSTQASGSITSFLELIRSGNAVAGEQLWETIYEELKAMARAQLAHERGRVTLEPTTLVHEVYLRFRNLADHGLASRQQFFAAAGLAMRRIRVDYARRQRSLKRGGDRSREELAEVSVFDQDAAEILAIDEALERLAGRDPRKAEVVNLRYFAGLTVDETAEALGVSSRTVDNEWRLARTWLFAELSGGA